MTQESLPLPGQRFDKRIGHHLLAWLLRLFFLVYGRWKVIGLENLPRTGGGLLAGNHASYLDPPMGWAGVYGTRRLLGVARDDLWKNRVVGYLLDCIGVFPVKRGMADRTMIRGVLDALAHGELVGLFPEGTRSPDGNLQPMKSGIALLVQKSGVPLIPVAFLGTYEMLPRDRKSLRRVPLTMVIGAPLNLAPDASREEITDTLMQAIAALMTAHGRPTEPPPKEEAGTRHEMPGDGG